MKKTQMVAVALGIVLIGAPVLAATEVMEKTTTTSYSGTVTEVNPTSSTIILRSQTAPEPVTYAITKQTTIVDPQGNTVSWEQVKNTPVTVFYNSEGDRMVVTKVVTSKPVTELRKETTTTTTERTVQ